MRNKIIWLLKCIKRNVRTISFWSYPNFIRLVCLDYKIHYADEKVQYELFEIKHQIMLNYIKDNYEKYRLAVYEGCKPVRMDLDDQNIWILWLQGEESMPEVVRVCYSNIKKYSNGHNVILLTNDNLGEYLLINQNIKNKVGKCLSYTAFSDYVRLNLLSLYGGLWIDATFFITQPLDEGIFRSEFFSIKNNILKNDVVCRYKWAVNFMYFKCNSQIITHVRNMFCAFWENNSKPINYLFIDYCFEYERNMNAEFDKLLSNLPYTNEHSHQIRLNFNKAFDEKEYENWLSNTSLFKLSYKGNLQKESIGGELSYYGYITSLLNH